ncbi:RimK family alpha-L-glutamate ligase [Pendulispora albinea]|uniref:ATP-grasp domain-containing protein n=1 Tax=Pendulispora albinea TaxID=2741071 RepID=A0ABZ2M8T6_9BACT
MTERIGLVVGYEDTFPPAFIAKVNETPGFRAELAKFGGTPERYQSPYRVLVDRLSHEVPYYRFHLKAAMLAGTYVVNDPFWWSADDKFFGFSLASKIGVTVPRTVMLPSKSYAPSIDPSRSLRNLEYPLDWGKIADYVKFPAILKPADGGGWKNVSRVNNMDELLRDYNDSNQLVMTLQEFIEFDEYVRCICIGKKFILPIKYDPRRRCYVEADNFLPKALEQKILDGAWALNHALGYDMNSVEFACKDGVPYAIDFTNPAPDMCVRSILPRYFHMVVDEMARFTIELAREGRKNASVHAFQKFLESPIPRPETT